MAIAPPPHSTLPAFVEPMLAQQAEPFDDPEWLFEIKWDGFRALCRRDTDDFRLLGRRRTDFTGRFGQLTRAMKKLPPGTILDGEIVALKDGRSDFSALQRARQRSRGVAIVYVAFDLLYENFSPLLGRTLRERRERLRSLVEATGCPSLIFSDGVVEAGVACFRKAVETGLEGIIAKRLDSRYRPGVRVGDWLKIKSRRTAACVVVGFEPSDEYGLRSLIIASINDGELKCVGRVGSGIDTAMRRRLLKELRSRQTPTPAVPCKMKGTWVEPLLFCQVSYAEVTPSGSLRAPVFEGLIERLSSTTR